MSHHFSLDRKAESNSVSFVAGPNRTIISVSSAKPRTLVLVHSLTNFLRFEGVIYSALTCRIIFNIYRTVENPMNVDLHTENPRAEEYSVALSTVVYAETDHWC